MAKKELKMRAVVAPTETVIVSAYNPDGKADAFRTGIEFKKSLEAADCEYQYRSTGLHCETGL